MPISISVIAPAYNSAAMLDVCLRALRQGMVQPCEIIVVDDGSTDHTTQVARDHGATVLRNESPLGPAAARNMGAKVAAGDVLFFVDSDVCVQPDTVLRVSNNFMADPALDALIGSYDTHPAAPDFLSQYRNLMHAFVHQHGAAEASTFWSGCGAIRKSVFLQHSGFNEGYGRPAIEDIELGYRLKRAGHTILLDPLLQVKHLKAWTFWGLVKTDVMDRGIPWTELILRDQCMPNDLNLQLSQRVSVALVYVLVALCASFALLSGAFALLPLLAILIFLLARWWGEFGAYKRPRVAFAVLFGCVLMTAGVAYACRMYGLIPALAVTPVLLALRHRYQRRGRFNDLHRWLGIVYIGASVVAAVYYLPNHMLLVCCFVVLALLGLLNSQFYIFLAGRRGPAFMLAAIPFHLLYHFYNGLSFVAGAGLHYWNLKRPVDDRAQIKAE